MSAGWLAWVVLLTGVYLLSLGSLNPLDAAEGLVLATALSLGLRGRLEGPHGAGSSLAGRVAAFPLLIGGLLADVLRGTWDVTLRVVGLRPIECSGIVLVPIGERTNSAWPSPACWPGCPRDRCWSRSTPSARRCCSTSSTPTTPTPSATTSTA